MIDLSRAMAGCWRVDGSDTGLGFHASFEFGVDEVVDSSLEYGGWVAALAACAVVFDAVVVDDLASDLRSPGRADACCAAALGFVEFDGALFLGDLLEFGLQDGEGLLSVLRLLSVGARDDHDVCWFVYDADCPGDLVDVLTARAAGTGEGGDFEVFLWDLDFNIFELA